MKDNEISIGNTGLKAGLIISASLIIYFMFMRSFSMTGSAMAWGFNFIILFGGIIFTFLYYRTKSKLNIEYFPGMLLGSVTTAVCTLIFTLFVYIYFSSIDPALLNLLKDNVLFMGKQITPLRAAVATLIEGICSGVIISFVMMQYYRSGFRRTVSEKTVQG